MRLEWYDVDKLDEAKRLAEIAENYLGQVVGISETLAGFRIWIKSKNEICFEKVDEYLQSIYS
ncbi:MAG: hypothetical protein GY718_14420 [Lentisphaerae bacterium]|nr:hypothetical protein [Lentisphaerota bacterium]